MESDLHWFGEWVYWDTEEEKEEAAQYLALWKKFFIKRMQGLIQDGEDQIILRLPQPEDSLSGMMPNLCRGTLGLKFALKGDLPNNVISKFDLRHPSID